MAAWKVRRNIALRASTPAQADRWRDLLPAVPTPAGYEVDRLRALDDADSHMQEITVEVGEPSLPVCFTGRWLVEPDSDETRTGGPGQDAGAYWGIAMTGRGRIAVLTAHCNERWPAVLRDYDSLDQAASDGVAADMIALAAAELGERRVLRRDI
jgi:hypothetical protein